MFAQSRRGNDSLGVRAPGFIPQSTKTLLSGVVNNMHDLPTWPKPPSVSSDTSDFCARRGLKICSPTCLRCFTLSDDEILSW